MCVVRGSPSGGRRNRVKRGARLAPDLDILEEVQQVHTEIAMRHGQRLAAELGIEWGKLPEGEVWARFVEDAVELMARHCFSGGRLAGMRNAWCWTITRFSAAKPSATNFLSTASV